MCGGDKREIRTVRTSFAEWPPSPREVVLVESIHQWVVIEHPARYFGVIGGVCERPELTRAWQWDPFRKSLSLGVIWKGSWTLALPLTEAEAFELPQLLLALVLSELS